MEVDGFLDLMTHSTSERSEWSVGSDISLSNIVVDPALKLCSLNLMGCHDLEPSVYVETPSTADHVSSPHSSMFSSPGHMEEMEKGSTMRMLPPDIHLHQEYIERLQIFVQRLEDHPDILLQEVAEFRRIASKTRLNIGRFSM